MITRHRLRWRIQHWLEGRLPGLLTCAQFQETLDAYLDGELGGPARMTVDFHMRTCPACRRYLAAYSKVRETAIETLSADETAALDEIPEDLVSAIMSARKAESGA
ncbi:MAG: anti-sigma factor family protein [Thalassobaculum sp.]